MEKIDLATVIQETISTFCRNRTGDKPPIYVTLAPAMTQVPWKNRALRDFVRCFLYEALSTSDPEASIEVEALFAERPQCVCRHSAVILGATQSIGTRVAYSGAGRRRTICRPWLPLRRVARRRTIESSLGHFRRGPIIGAQDGFLPRVRA